MNIKARSVTGKNLRFKNATVDDAEFILSLRTDSIKSKYLSGTDSDLDKQKSWLEKYNLDPEQAYFIITNNDGEKIGTVRLYDIKENSFCWGSWILSNQAPSSAAIESALMVYQYAFSLGFKAAHFDVRKENNSVWSFHERFGAIKVGETELDFLYNINADAINSSLNKYKRYTSENLIIEN